MYDIIVRFPDEATAKEFCGQMCDGAGEGICDFTPFRRLPNTDGTKNEHYERVTSSAPEGTPVYFVDSMFEI